MSKHTAPSTVITALKTRAHAAGTGTQLVMKFEGSDKEYSVNVYKGQSKPFALNTDCQEIKGKPSTKNKNAWIEGSDIESWITEGVKAAGFEVAELVAA